MKLGILANEFFDETLGRMGGFGWAARQVAKFFNSQPSLGVNVVFLAGSLKGRSERPLTLIHETEIIFYSRDENFPRIVRQQKLDLILTIDYRPQYRGVLENLSDTPVIIWVRDPNPPEIRAFQATLRLPGKKSMIPKGAKKPDCTSLSSLLEQRMGSQSPFLFATPASSLGSLIEGAYNVSGVNCHFLPNIVNLEVEPIRKHHLPRVVFLGRLDPIKRPWIFVQLARLFPNVEFLMIGQSHFHGPGSWQPGRLPENVFLLGHIDGKKKTELLSSAWVLVNTSIHEALPTSFLEALVCEIPLLSCTNRENVVSQFGIFTGFFGGDGLKSLPQFASSLELLLADSKLRTYLGKKGRKWVMQTHSGRNFLCSFDKLSSAIGVNRTPIVA